MTQNELIEVRLYDKEGREQLKRRIKTPTGGIECAVAEVHESYIIEDNQRPEYAVLSPHRIFPEDLCYGIVYDTEGIPLTTTSLKDHVIRSGKLEYILHAEDGNTETRISQEQDITKVVTEALWGYDARQKQPVESWGIQNGLDVPVDEITHIEVSNGKPLGVWVKEGYQYQPPEMKTQTPLKIRLIDNQSTSGTLYLP
ncbi:MAG: hypothetical protein WC254_01025 [Candidatus Woesearchaeota archaeon]|jgi:hypothetical protein